MALIGNYSVFNKNPGKWRAGTSTCDRSAYNQSGMSRNMYYGDAGTVNLNTVLTDYHIVFYQGLPSGYNTGWMLPQYSGYISSINGILGAGTMNTSNLAGGLNGVAAITGTGSLSNAILNALGLMTLSLNAAGSMTPVISAQISAAATLAANGSLTAALGALSGAVAAIQGTGSVNVDIIAKGNQTATLAGVGSVSNANLTALAFIASNILGSGLFTANGAGALYAVSNISGAGSVVANLTAVGNIVSALQGLATLTASVIGEEYMYANISALAQLNVDIQATISGLSNINGVGAVNPTISGAGQASVNISGHAQLVASITALGNAICTLLATSTFTIADGPSFGNMQAPITIGATDPLSPEALAASLWNSIAANYNLNGTMGHIMNSVGAGTDPWQTNLPGSYTGIQAGKILADLEAITKQVKALTILNYTK